MAHHEHAKHLNQKTVKHRRWIMTLVIFGIMMVGMAGFWAVKAYNQGQTAALAPYPVRGCVIDQDAGMIDFQTLAKQDVNFVYLNGTTGATYFDDSFNTNYNRIQSTNIQVGVIHNFSFQKSAKAQLKFIARKIKSNTGQLPIAIRVNYYGELTADKVNWKKQGPILAELVRLVANYYGQSVVIKTTPAIQKQLNHRYIKQSPFWIEEQAIKKRTKQRVDFVEYDRDRAFNSGRSKVELPASYFNGTVEKWNQQTN
jgi:lysozyme